MLSKNTLINKTKYSSATADLLHIVGPKSSATTRTGDIDLSSFGDVTGVDLEYPIGIPSELVSLRREFNKLKDAILNKRASTLTSLGIEGFRLRLPLAVEIHDEDGTVTAHASDLELWGAGDSEYEAFANLRETIVESFLSLTELGFDNLGPQLQNQLIRIREIVEVA